jgi:hypothetical protein
MAVQWNRFLMVGENIHCTRSFRVDGKFVVRREGGGFAVVHGDPGEERFLPVPAAVVQGDEWQAGKVRHCAVAIRVGADGTGSERDAGREYIRVMARRQAAAGAAYLEVNVDEVSTDLEDRKRLMAWTVRAVQESVPTPVSVDSSNLEVLRAGLAACDPGRGRALLNSVSLERQAGIELACEFQAAVIASCAGEREVPSTAEERVANLERLLALLDAAGVERAAVHVDPLVLPISVDGQNGRRFLDAVRMIREAYGPSLHIVPGLNNVSFGLPRRALVSLVFTRLAMEAGVDGGIVDPLQINPRSLAALSPSTESFRLAHALLTGDDEFGGEFIAACREERI